MLELTAGSRRARVNAEETEVQPRLLDHLLRKPLSTAAAAQRRLSETLFELLLPLHMKKASAERQNVLLVLDEATAHYPWELLADRFASDRQPVGVSAGLVRQLRLRQVREVVSHPDSTVALVVGDPPSSLVDLPRAEEEARRVADLLERRGWEVVRQIRHDATSEKAPGESEIGASSIIGQLMTRDARVLHLAGHGVYEAGEPGRIGMVVGQDGGELLLFSPSEVAQMRLVPDLVFVNCCHLGYIETTPLHRLAAGFATRFIANGVRAVVAAGWAVDDEAAFTFATVFYDEMFRGHTFGDAVREARRRTFAEHPATNTWAAYQCYGDPGFRLMMEAEPGPASRPELDLPPAPRRPSAGLPLAPRTATDDFADPVELVVALDNLRGRAQCAKSDRAMLERLGAELSQLVEGATAHAWDGLPEVAAALGRASMELSDWDAAIRYLDLARGGESGTVTLHDLEQLANGRARRAADRVLTGELDADDGVAQIRRAIDELESLRGIAATRERWSLLGSARKRLIRVRTAGAGADPAEVAAEVRHMAEAYGKAAAADPDDLYAKLNALAATLLLGGPWKRPPKKHADNPLATTEAFDQALAEAREEARYRRESTAGQRDFWSFSYAPDAELLAALHGGELTVRCESLTENYRALFRGHGSPREHASVIDQLDFLKQLLAAPASASKSASADETAKKGGAKDRLPGLSEPEAASLRKLVDDLRTS